MAGGNSNPTTPGASTLPTTPSWSGGSTGSGTVQNVFDAPSTKQFGGQLVSDARAVYNQGPKTFNKSLYAGMGDATNAGLMSMLGVDPSTYNNGLMGAMGDYADVAAGNQIGRGDPNYERLRSKMMADVSGDVNSTFTNSGRFGGGSHVSNLTSSLADSVAGMDYGQLQDSYGRQNQALSALPGIYQAMMAPGQNQLGVGQVMDQDAQARLTAENDLYRRQQDAGFTHIANNVNMLNGGAGKDGVLTPDAPWWLGALGTAADLGGKVIGSAFGG
jgi:hypothetical protein